MMITMHCLCLSGQKEFVTTAFLSCVRHACTGDNVHKERICKIVPCGVTKNCAFLIDFQALSSPHDIFADDNGVWHNNGVRTIFVDCSISGTSVLHRGNRLPYPMKTGHFKLVCTYYCNKAAGDFLKMIAQLYDMLTCDLILIVGKSSSFYAQ